MEGIHEKKPITTDKAPAPVGPYSQGIIAGCLLFVSGQIPLYPDTGKLVMGNFRAAARRAMENLKAIVEASGASMGDVVKVTVYIRDIKKFPEFNEVYKEYFDPPYPARAVVEVSNLPLNAPLEVEAVVYICGRTR